MNNHKYKERQPEHHDCDEQMFCCPLCGQPYGVGDIVRALVDLFEEMRGVYDDDDTTPFEEDELIEAIEEYASAVACGDAFLVWVPLENLNEFIYPLLDETLQCDELHVVMDGDTAMFDLTEVCLVYGLDMEAIYEQTNL